MRQSSIRLIAGLGLLLALAGATHAIGSGPDGPPPSHAANRASTATPHHT
ncbi:hypothetical protein [Knoellia koreensis]|uniref:Uncharacterized protein n=1 Tax=Knoellia koreensis TaxID=2730921 RepID=A0A849HEB6_9MICO|nr:hypothetical protein [Knoellia sp. DB2414S]NNM45469.1 hypothetical protein [Knoellia sp. DB2414S]